MTKSTFKRAIPYLLLISFTVVTGVTIWIHRYDLNPDGISYIEIARNYRRGLISESLSAYWSPVYSWLLIPLSFLFDWVTSAKILQLLISVMWFAASLYLAEICLFSKTQIVLVALLNLVSVPWFTSINILTPDALLAVFVVFILAYVLRTIKYNQKTNWFYYGLLVAIGYLIKSYFLIFGCIFFLYILIVYAPFPSKRIFFRYFLVGLIPFIYIWSELLYMKYHQLTLGTNAVVTYKKYVLDEEFKFLKEPVMYPRSGTAYWYDPSDFSNIQINWGKQLNSTAHNFKVLFIILFQNFHIGIIFLLFQNKLKYLQKLLVMFCLIWSVLYVVNIVEIRYLLPILTPIVICIVSLYSKQRRILFCLTVIICCILFLKSSPRIFIPDTKSFTHYTIHKQLSSPCTLLSDDWARGLYVSFLAGCKYYGVSRILFNSQNKERVINQEIEQGKVTHYLSFKQGNQFSQILKVINSWYEGEIIINLYHVNKKLW